MLPLILAVVGGYLVGDSIKDKKVFANGGMMAKGGKVGYTDTFEEVYDDGGMQSYYIRKWGNVMVGIEAIASMFEVDENQKEIELVAVANIKDLAEYVSEDELPKSGNFNLSITLVPLAKFMSKKMLKAANDENSSISDNSEVNVDNYMGGLNYSPEEKNNFPTLEAAVKYLHSKKLNDRISADAKMAGYILDRNYNRAGQSNYDYLDYMTGITERFEDGGMMKKGGVARSKKVTYVPQDEIESISTWNGVSFEGDDILDGAYIKGKNRKFAKGGTTSSFMFEIGDKVMVDDSGYVKSFSGFDISKPATIIKRSKTKSGGKTVVFYEIETANGERPFNSVRESKLSKAMLAKGGMMAKGGSVASIFSKYEENEENNAHSENVVLLATHFGTKEDLKKAKSILNRHMKAGSLTKQLSDERSEIEERLYPKLVEALKK